MAILILLGVLNAIPDPRRARRALVWLAMAGLLTGTVLQALHYFTPVDLPMNAFRNGVFVEFPYAVFGFLLADRISRKGPSALLPERFVAAALALLAALRLAEATFYLHLYGPDLNFPPEFPFLAAAFSLCLLVFTLRLRLPPPPADFAFLSVMVYFLHFFVLLVALKLGIGSFAGLAVAGIAVPVMIGLAIQKGGGLLRRRLPAPLATALLHGVLRLPSRSGESQRDKEDRSMGRPETR